MKKTALIILLTAMSALSSFGQSAYDAWRFSQNEYEGTARSAAMGNAFTALGLSMIWSGISLRIADLQGLTVINLVMPASA